MTRRLATDGASRSATAMTAREYASSASVSAGVGGSATRLIAPARLAVRRSCGLLRGEGRRHGPLVDAADHGQLEVAAGGGDRVEGRVERLDVLGGAAAGRHDQVALLHARASGGAAVLDRPH